MISEEATEEIAALACIYPTELQRRTETEVSITLPKNSHGEKFTATFTFPHNYPNEGPPKCRIDGLEAKLEKMCKESVSFQPGQLVVFEWMEAFREIVENNPVIVKKPPSPPVLLEEKGSTWHREIFTSEQVLDRKSKFIARATAVHSVQEVKQFKINLLQDKHIAKATHPLISAYRISAQNGTVNADCDDDGEDAAGGRLAHLLQMCHVQDAVVVVSRWYGGIQLGPDRFKHISRVARQALELGNFIRK
jgi:hypothetical protein